MSNPISKGVLGLGGLVRDYTGLLSHVADPIHEAVAWVMNSELKEGSVRYESGNYVLIPDGVDDEDLPDEYELGRFSAVAQVIPATFYLGISIVAAEAYPGLLSLGIVAVAGLFSISALSREVSFELKGAAA
jgi:hypothetical protein